MTTGVTLEYFLPWRRWTACTDASGGVIRQLITPLSGAAHLLFCADWTEVADQYGAGGMQWIPAVSAQLLSDQL